MTTQGDSRTRLLRAAEQTTYRQGFGRASIADIAKRAGIPVGNVYYHFKTKDEIGNAIIERRMERFRRLLRDLSCLPDPKDRLCAFVNLKIKNRRGLSRGGCPVGTLCSELRKEGGSAAKNSSVLFATALDWMEAQFLCLRQGAASRGLAIHLLSATQGMSILAHTMHDPTLIDRESRHLKQWIRSF